MVAFRHKEPDTVEYAPVVAGRGGILASILVRLGHPPFSDLVLFQLSVLGVKRFAM